jgi:XisH protein
MPAHDVFHAAVKKGLSKDGWNITDDPFLAVALDTFETFFALPFTQAAVQHHKVHLIVYDPESEVIVRWLE